MLATVAWLGGLFAYAWLVLPSIRRTIAVADQVKFMSVIRRRLQQVGWMSLLVLVATGMFQMSANPNYEGLLSISNTWAGAMMVKHLAVGLMVIVSAMQTWWLIPAMERLVMRRAGGLEDSSNLIIRLQKIETTLRWLNLGGSVLVLALTAVARVA